MLSRTTSTYRLASWLQNTTWLTLTTVIFFTTGCHKKSPEKITTYQESPATAATASATENQTASSPPAPPVKPVPPNATVLNDPTVHANLRQLDAQLNQYLARYHQMPKTFAAFAAASNLQIPEPPAGMRYVIYHATVTLESRDP